MHLGELYRAKLDKAAFWLQSAREHVKPLIRRDFRRRADECDHAAQDVAHCIAAFGDLDTATMDFGKLRATIEGWSCSGRNPWRNGLDVIEDNTRATTAG